MFAAVSGCSRITCKSSKYTVIMFLVIHHCSWRVGVLIGVLHCVYPTLVMVNRYPPPGYTHSPEPVLPSSLNVPLAYAGEPFSPAQIVRVSPSSS